MDLNRYVRRFHDDHVMMSKADTELVAKRRDIVKQRIRSRLSKQKMPKVFRWIPQGSYAMNTMIRNLSTGEPDMDLDIGVVFRYEDFISSKGEEKSPQHVKKIVANALQYGLLEKSPRARKNCVTVNYSNEGKIDVPVYRITRFYNQESYLELASDQWKISDPRGINDWFRDSCERSPENGGSLQLRRLVRLFKVLGRMQNPRLSGFAITVLVVSNYRPVADRDDRSFYLTGKAMHANLSKSKRIAHPILMGHEITNSAADLSVSVFADRLGKKMQRLKRAFTSGVSKEKALSDWHYVFQHDCFTE